MTSDTTVELIRAIVDNLEDAPNDWASLALVLGFDTEKVNMSFGYTYSPDGKISDVGVDPYQVRSGVKAYTDSYYPEGAKLPVALLLQFDRDAGKYEITFEDTDESRWKLTPANFETLAQELRPNFSGQAS